MVNISYTWESSFVQIDCSEGLPKGVEGGGGFHVPLFPTKCSFCSRVP